MRGEASANGAISIAHIGITTSRLSSTAFAATRSASLTLPSGRRPASGPSRTRVRLVEGDRAEERPVPARAAARLFRVEFHLILAGEVRREGAEQAGGAAELGDAEHALAAPPAGTRRGAFEAPPLLSRRVHAGTEGARRAGAALGEDRRGRAPLSARASSSSWPKTLLPPGRRISASAYPPLWRGIAAAGRRCARIWCPGGARRWPSSH